MHGCTAKSTFIKIKDEKTGKNEIIEVGPPAGVSRNPLWRAFGRSIYEYMKELGLKDSMFWGHAFDDTFDPDLVALMTEVTPGVGWTAGSHARKPDPTFRAVALAYGMSLTPKSMMGWKNPDIVLLMPRTGGSMICVEGISTPFTWRVMCDRTIYCGLNGLGRMGADYFDRTWMEGFRGGAWLMVGRPCVQTLWPGENTINSSARNEVMLEGMQEAEVRIYLEQAFDRGKLPADLAKKVTDVLQNHFLDTLQIAAGGVDYITMDFHGDWQGRSRKLYTTAAEVAKTIGLDVNRTVFGQAKIKYYAGRQGSGKVVEKLVGRKLFLPAFGRKKVEIKLRNWTGKPRTFKIASIDPWIVPEENQGTVTGQKRMGITLYGKDNKPGTDITGTFTVTDTQSGISYPVTVGAHITKAMNLKLIVEVSYETGGGAGGERHRAIHRTIHPIFNAESGGTDSRKYFLSNNTSDTQSFTISMSDDWLKAVPASGRIKPESTIAIEFIASPKPNAAGLHKTTVTFNGADGKVQEEYKVKIFALPPYKPVEVPKGEGIFLNDLNQKEFVEYHMEYGSKTDSRKRPRGIYYHRSRSCGENLNPKFNYSHDGNKFARDPYTMDKKKYMRGLWAMPTHETAYNIGGSGFKAFTATVGFSDIFRKHSRANKGAQVIFEVHVDGKIKAHSGIMKVMDKPKLLVVTGLENAKQIKLITRRDDMMTDDHCLATWGDPKFIK
jgi:hypothetical protein